MSELPTLTTMAKELVKTAKDVVSQAATTGIISASEDKAKTRMSMCLACEFFVKEQTRCGKCGCYMEAKVKLDVAKCPVGKW